MTSDYTNDIVIREKIAETMEVEIDDACEAGNDNSFRKRLGSSQIGKSCSREIWYGFRWAKRPVLGSANRPAGRVVRLFNRGHREEPVLIEYLKKIGCTFEPPPEGKEQHPFSDCDDHAGTEVDSIGHMPEKFGVSEKVLFEFKTANLAGFNKMKKEGIQRAQPKYWAQVNFAGRMAGLKYVLFVVVSKNDDDIHIEFHTLDDEYSEMLKDKALYIITATEPPTKISQSSTNFACKYCAFIDICHNDEPVEKNCRSCVHAKASAKGKWVCTCGNQCTEIPEEILPKGCDYHQGID